MYIYCNKFYNGKEQLKRIFEFLKEKEEHKAPFMWKLKNDIPLTEEDLNIEGILDLSYTYITSLPEGLKVGSGLYLSHTSITSLPKVLEVGGRLFIENTPLKKYTDEELREMVKPGFIKGKIKR